MKITDELKARVLELRSAGMSYSKIVKATGLSRTSVINLTKVPKTNEVLEAKVKKHCPNPRILIIYFDNILENDAKCVVRPEKNYPVGKTLHVKKVKTSEEPLYRIA